jgi:adiponectin receptor
MTKPGDGWATKTKIRCLCSASDLPSWHFAHRGIKSGYRSCDSFKSAINSLFYWHNESVNVWMHYLSASVLIFQCLYAFVSIGMEKSEILIKFDKIALVVTIVLGNFIPMFLSAFCHSFYCISKEWHKVCWFLDFLGILTGELWGSIGFLYLSFYCNKQLVLLLVSILLIIYFYFIQFCWIEYSNHTNQLKLQPRDRFPEFSKYLSTFGFITSFIPLFITILFKNEYRNNSEFHEIFIISCVGPVAMALGIVFFAQGNFPERFCKNLNLPLNYFDFIGHSHQWWHLVSSILMFVWVFLLRKHYEIRMKYGCFL